MKTLAVTLCAVTAVSCLALDGAEARRARCALPQEISAIRTAAIQQQLMVAALTCNEVQRFNAFQTGFGPELRASDAALARMFRRLYGPKRGEAAYHAFKTKLANDFEMRSIHNNPAYCQEAGAMLATALSAERPPLVAFVRNTSVNIEQAPAQACGVETTLAGEPRPLRHHRRRRLASK